MDGFTLHAGVTVAAGDRALRERLCRYVVRPAFALGRLELRDDGRVAYRCKESGRQRWRVMEPLELLARLAALVPPPRYPELRYSGVLALDAKWMPVVVPTKQREATRVRRCAERVETSGSTERADAVAVRIDAVPWAELLRRVHGVDALGCRRCGQRMRVIAVLVDARTAQRVLRAAGERWETAPRARARDPGSG